MVDNVTRISADFLTSLPEQSSDVYGVFLARAAIYCVVWPVIIIVGVFGNVLSMIVIWRTKDFTTTAKFLTSLAVADTLTLIVKGVQVVFTLGDIFWPIQYLTWKLSVNSIFNLSLLPDRISKGITVAMVCDRVVGITVPLRYKLICLPRRISTIIAMVYIVIAVTSLPHIVDFFAYHFISVENRTIHTDMGEEYVTNVVSHSTVKRLHFIINILVFDCMPIIVVFLCNIIIIISLRNRDVLASTTNEVQLQRKLQGEADHEVTVDNKRIVSGPGESDLYICYVPIFPRDTTAGRDDSQAGVGHPHDALPHQLLHQLHRLCRHEQEIQGGLCSDSMSLPTTQRYPGPSEVLKLVWTEINTPQFFKIIFLLNPRPTAVKV